MVPGTVDETVSVAEAPKQISVADGVMVSTGVGFTVTVVTADPVQPLAVVPVTVYVVVLSGDTVIEGVVAPLDHTNVVPAISEEAVSVVLSPEQMVAAFTVMTGFGFTVTVTESIFSHNGANEISSSAKSFPLRMIF